MNMAMNVAKLEYDLAYAKQQIVTMTAELAATRAELEKAQLALRESEANNAKLSQHIEQRANGADPLTQQLRAEKWQAIEQLKEAQKTIERQRSALLSAQSFTERMGGFVDSVAANMLRGLLRAIERGLGADHA